VEQERLATVERDAALVTAGRRKLASGWYLSDNAAAAGTSKWRGVSTTRRTARRNLQKTLDAVSERLTMALDTAWTTLPLRNSDYVWTD
jgi:hypothetical protein